MPRLIAQLLGIFALIFTTYTFAIEIPKSLEEWRPWVLEKHQDLNCPFLFNDSARTCIWPSELRIDATNSGARFLQHVEVFKNDWVALPGNGGFWPQNVTDNNNKVAVRDNENTPEVYLTIGTHELNGDIRWNEMPRTLKIPEQTGIVQLTLNGKSVTTPAIEDNNQLWLAVSEKQNAETHQDTFNIRVFRKIDDQIPLQITTQLQIDVSGKEREIQLGQFLLTGFTATELKSELPSRIERDGSLRIQLKPGSWELTLLSQSNKPINDLTFKATSELWPQEEIWVFEAQRKLRSTQISGVQTIDPQQTQLPDNWKNLPAYLMTPETHFKIEELNRGESKDIASDLKLNRDAWLSFDSKKFIFHDNVSGSLSASRLETIDPMQLTNADSEGKPQLITHLAGSKNSGFEIRKHEINIAGTSELARSFNLPVTGWNQDFNSVATTLYLPPAWSLLTATGTSNESGSWISEWSLWDIFLVLLIIVAIARTTKIAYGALAAVTLIIIYQREGAPIFIWLNLIAAITLASFVSGSFKNYLVKYTYISFLLLAVIVLPFAVREARAIINPQLENKEFFEINICALASCSSDSKKKAPVAMVDSIEAEDVGKMPDAALAESLQRIQGVSVRKMQAPKPTVIKKSYLPNQQTQTGLAEPSWRENSVYLYWNGPVKADEKTTLFLVPPFINRLGYLLSAILPLLLGGILLRQFFIAIDKKFEYPNFKKTNGAAVLPVLLIIGLWFSPVEPAKADVTIDQNILKELEERLTQTPRCLPSCASIENVKLIVNNDELTLDLIVHSSDLISLPLPVDHEQWWPSQVTIDGKNASLVQTDSAELLVSLPKGRHNLIVRANLQGRDALSLSFPIPLHSVTSSTNGWELSGAPTTEQASQSLQLQRVERSEVASKSEHLRPEPIAPFVIVRRQLQLGLEWTAITTVTRVAPAFGAINIEVPLIEGESPLTTQVNANGKISVHLEANEESTEWNSSIKQATPLELEAAQNNSWVEIWTLDVSPIWHTEIKGVAPIQLGKNENTPIWQPWPGEKISLVITRPEATKGSYITVDFANLTHTPGERSSTNELLLSIRANQGGQYSFALPKNTKLTSVVIDQNQQSLSTIDGLVKIPLHPGKQNISIKWTDEEGASVLNKSPKFSLDQGSSNQRITINLLGNRWPLFVGGPSVGPSILIWGMLIIVVIVSFALGRSGITPLKTWQWILLSLGICTQNFSTFIIVAVWLIVLQRRGALENISSSRKFKWMQFGLFALSLIALGSLLSTIPDGLLGSPDMHIAGNNSYAGTFNWYQDHSDLEFPTAWVISLPLWCYKLAILLWALWLASALLGWIRWGWQQLTHYGIWNPASEIVLFPVVKKGKSNTADTVIVTTEDKPA